MTNDETKDDAMTAASNPAAELTEAERRHLRDCAQISWGHLNTAVERILAARLPAGGAATDEGLRARVEALAADFDRRWATMSVREVAAALHALADAAPAPTEDATACTACDNCHGLSIGPNTDGDPCPWCRVCGCHEANHPAVSRAPVAAAEEPRTDAQAVGACGMYSCPRFQDGMCYCPGYEIKPKPDRLSRADEEAGS